MDDHPCRQFFREPVEPLQRRYEALRAFFIDGQRLRDIAQRLGYSYGALRNLVSEFRGQCYAGQVSPLFNSSSSVAPVPIRPKQPDPKLPPSRIAGS